ncbi:MAG: O-antigen ligase family protein [Acutalibacteraceae bacterium]
MESVESNVSENTMNKVLWAFVFLSPFIIGGFHVVVSCVYSLFLMVFLCIYSVVKGSVSLKFSLPLIMSTVILSGYLLTSFWAVDSGSAIFGFIKYLPVVLFAVCISGTSNSEREYLLSAVPVSGAVMTLVSYPLSFIDSISKFFLVSGRLGGFFQYPNTYAVFCLLGIIILLTKQRIGLKEVVLSLVLLGGVFLSGSRTVFVLLLLTAAVLVFKIKNKKHKFIIIGAVAVALVLSVITVFVTDSVQNAGRFITISLNSSTFLGRILYYIDALPVILKHPLGLGYGGYYYAQQEFQTGVYSVMFAHNDVLQYFLDIGWVPAIVFVAGVAMSFFSKRKNFTQKFLLFILFAHILFDFDMQFISMSFVLLMLLDWDAFTVKNFELKTLPVGIVSGALVIPVIFFGIVNFYSLTKNYSAVDKLYPFDTEAQTHLMIEEGYSDTAVDYATAIVKRNDYSAIAHTVLANKKYSQGDIAGYIDEKSRAIEISKYSIEEYNDFAFKLVAASQQYRAYGDVQSARYCEKEIMKLEEILANVEQETNPLAWRIADKPELVLDGQISEYINLIKEQEGEDE